MQRNSHRESGLPVLRVAQFVEGLHDLEYALRRALADALVVVRQERDELEHGRLDELQEALARGSEDGADGVRGNLLLGGISMVALLFSSLILIAGVADSPVVKRSDASSSTTERRW